MELLTDEVVSALVIACITAIVLAAFRLSNPANGAEHYYLQRNRAAYKLMQVCYFVIVVALAFNVRFIAVHFGRAALARFGFLW